MGRFSSAASHFFEFGGCISTRLHDMKAQLIMIDTISYSTAHPSIV